MPQIVTLRSKGQCSEDVISLVLSQDAVCVGPNGDPWCGVTLNSEQARSLAQRLCNIADEIENGEQSGYGTSTPFFDHVSSVAVIHDGSQQGHRAFQAGIQCASRVLGRLHLFGIFGVDTRGNDAVASADDCEWQKGWLSRLIEMYSQRAGTAGITFDSMLLPAHDPCLLLDTLYKMEFDLVVIPKSLTRFGVHGERLMPSIISRHSANVLVCS
jgi:hypothetical protein